MSNQNSVLSSLLPEFTNLQKEIVSLQERLDLVDQNKEKVRIKIYEKVRGDYLKKLEELFAKLNPYKDKFEEEITLLEGVISELKQKAEVCEEEAEEIQLRYFAGEFADEDFQPRQDELNQQLEEIQKDITKSEISISEFKKHLAFINGESYVEPESPQPSFDLDQPVYEPVIEKPEAPEPEEVPPYEEVLEEEKPIEDALESVPEPPVYETETVEEDPEEEEEEEPSSTFLSDTLGGEEIVSDEPAPIAAEAGESDEYIWDCTAVLDVIEGDFTGESYPMDKDRMTIGRGPNNDIQLATDTSVSRHHAQITFESNRYYLMDLESSNGTSVNGIRVTRIALRPDDEVTIGQSKLVIRPSQE